MTLCPWWHREARGKVYIFYGSVISSSQVLFQYHDIHHIDSFGIVERGSIVRGLSQILLLTSQVISSFDIWPPISVAPCWTSLWVSICPVIRRILASWGSSTRTFKSPVMIIFWGKVVSCSRWTDHWSKYLVTSNPFCLGRGRRYSLHKVSSGLFP